MRSPRGRRPIRPARLGHWVDAGGVNHALTVEELRRWEDHGASWRVLELSESRVEVELCTCVGEPVDVGVSIDTEVVAYVREHAGRVNS